MSKVGCKGTCFILLDDASLIQSFNNFRLQWLFAHIVEYIHEMQSLAECSSPLIDLFDVLSNFRLIKAVKNFLPTSRVDISILEQYIDS